VKFAAPLIAVVLLATPAAAFTPERAGIMVDAVRANGCEMVGSEAPAALEPLGLDAVEVESFVDVLYGAELVTLSEDMQTLSLAEGLCAAEGDAAMAMIVAAFAAQETELRPWRPEFSPERGADLIAIIRGNACAMTDQQAAEILPGHDFDPVVTRDIVSLLIEDELANVSADGVAITLSPELCAADPVTDVATVQTVLTNWAAANDPQEGGE